MSYKTDCEDCSDRIPSGARYCPWCGTEQQRAVEAIERMRSWSSSSSAGEDEYVDRSQIFLERIAVGITHRIFGPVLDDDLDEEVDR